MTNDPILYWNEVALEANKVSHTTKQDGAQVNGPTLSSRALAIIHIAMYDAYIGTSGSALTKYLGYANAPAGASVTAAIGAAAHATLSKLYPSQKATFELMHSKAMISGTTDEINEGHKYGLEIANLILSDRKNDPNASDDGYAPYPSHGCHRPDPWDNKQGYHAPFYGANSHLFSSTPFALDTPPVALDSDPKYNKAIKQVRGKGIIPELMGTLPSSGYSKRTVDETLIGIFWGYDGANELGTPPRLYNQIIKEIAVKAGTTLEQNAHLFALINVAMGDAGILAWKEKFRHNYWRPVVGIREHDHSMGPLGTPNNNIDNDCDPLWLPLGAPNSNSKDKNNATPSFPAYPSGHATFGAATFEIAKMFFANEGINLTPIFNNCAFVSDEFNGTTTDSRGIIRPRHARKFTGFDQMILENGLSRVYLGVHWEFDAFERDAAGVIIPGSNIGGVPLGKNIANVVFNGGAGLIKA